MLETDAKELPLDFAFDEAFKKLDGLLNSLPTTDSSTSQAVTSAGKATDSFFTSIDLFRLIKKEGLPWFHPQISTGPEGSMNFQWLQNDKYLELIIKPNKSSQFIKGLYKTTSEIIDVKKQSFDAKLISVWKWLIE